MRSRRLPLALLLPIIGGVACNAILGIEDQPFRDDSLEGGAVAEVGTETSSPPSPPPDDASTSAYRAAVLEDVPVVYLRFGERGDPLGTKAKDEMMSNLAPTYPPTGLSLGVPGALMNDEDTAIRFDGTAKITMPDGVDFEGRAPFSVELWYKMKPGADGYQHLIDHEIYEPRRGWDFIVSPEGVYFERWSTIVSPVTPFEPAPTIGEWHHLVGVFEGDGQRLYIDGVLAKAVPPFGALSIARVTGGFTIGGINCECSNPKFIGDLDEVAIYDHVLTDTRVAIHYRKARP